MSFERSTTITLALMVLSIISITSIQHDAFAWNDGMKISATALEGSDSISVSGQTKSQNTDITFTVLSPNRNVVSINQLTPDTNGDFATEFKVPMWKENGFYTITAQQSLQSNSIYEVSVNVQVIDGKTTKTDVNESTIGVTEWYAPETPIKTGLVIREANAIAGSNIIAIGGTTDSENTITMKVIEPNGNIVVIDQFAPSLDSKGDFLKEITTGGPLWNQDGDYTIVAQQGDDPLYKYSITVGIKDGVVIPEFGAIAVMILAVSIISIIAVSAKSRLSIMPKY